jgi:ketosteroid isomerase-like protein
MSRENVELLERCWEAVARRGPEALLDFADPALEWHVRQDLPDAGVYRGHQGFRALLERFDEAFEEQGYEPVEFIDAGGEVVVVPLRWWGRGRGSGATVVERYETWVFTVRERRIASVREFRTRDEALEAAGLSE